MDKNFSNISSFQSTYHYNGSSLLDTITTQWWNTGTLAWENFMRKINTYSGSSISMSLMQQWSSSTGWGNVRKASMAALSSSITSYVLQVNNSVWIPDDSFTVLYYTIPTTLNTPSATNISCTIYPVPATSYIDIQLNQSDEQPVAYAIFSMQGQLISKGSEPAAKNITKRISVDGLANGQSVLYINNKKEELYKKITIAH